MYIAGMTHGSFMPVYAQQGNNKLSNNVDTFLVSVYTQVHLSDHSSSQEKFGENHLMSARNNSVQLVMYSAGLGSRTLKCTYVPVQELFIDKVLKGA